MHIFLKGIHVASLLDHHVKVWQVLAGDVLALPDAFNPAEFGSSDPATVSQWGSLLLQDHSAVLHVQATQLLAQKTNIYQILHVICGNQLTINQSGMMA